MNACWWATLLHELLVLRRDFLVGLLDGLILVLRVRVDRVLVDRLSHVAQLDLRLLL